MARKKIISKSKEYTPKTDVSSYECSRSTYGDENGGKLNGINTGFKEARGCNRNTAKNINSDQVIKEDGKVYERREEVTDFNSGYKVAKEVCDKPLWRTLLGL